MGSDRMPRTRDLIVALNSLSIGELEVLRARLGTVKGELLKMGQQELALCLDEALQWLEQGRTSESRPLISDLVSRMEPLRLVAPASSLLIPSSLCAAGEIVSSGSDTSVAFG